MSVVRSEAVEPRDVRARRRARFASKRRERREDGALFSAIAMLEPGIVVGAALVAALVTLARRVGAAFDAVTSSRGRRAAVDRARRRSGQGRTHRGGEMSLESPNHGG